MGYIAFFAPLVLAIVSFLLKLKILNSNLFEVFGSFLAVGIVLAILTIYFHWNGVGFAWASIIINSIILILAYLLLHGAFGIPKVW